MTIQTILEWVAFWITNWYCSSIVIFKQITVQPVQIVQYPSFYAHNQVFVSYFRFTFTLAAISKQQANHHTYFKRIKRYFLLFICFFSAISRWYCYSSNLTKKNGKSLQILTTEIRLQTAQSILKVQLATPKIMNKRV